MLLWIVLATLFVSAISLVGIAVIGLREQLLNKILLGLVALAAGALIGNAFFHIIPEIVGEAYTLGVPLLTLFTYLVAGLALFFIFEQYLGWHHHCHDMKHAHHKERGPGVLAYSILVSDGIHNFVDGLVIAAAFVTSIPLGIATVIGIVLHEIPQEIGDFGVLVYSGMTHKRALVLNFISALTAVVGSILGFFLSEAIGGLDLVLLALAAGSFIYIALSDLIPELKHQKDGKKAFLYFAVFAVGLVFMWATAFFA